MQVRPSTFEENLPHQQYTPTEYVVATALAKAKDVWQHGEADILISADTVVVDGDKILEKPQGQQLEYT